MNTAKLVADLKRVTRDAEELLESTAGDVSDRAKEVRGRLRKTLAAARESCEQLQERALDGARTADVAIREHPYQSIGVAFGVGLLLGMLALRPRAD